MHRNSSVEHGLVNNARVEIMYRRCQSHRKTRYTTFHPPYSTWTINRRRFSLRTAYATTFNSCQGLRPDQIAVDLRSFPFVHGQLYTVLPRIRTKNDILVLFGDENHSKHSKNVVYINLLL